MPDAFSLIVLFSYPFALERQQSMLVRGGCRTAATPKMELFVIIVTKCSIFDVAAVLDPPLLVMKLPMYLFLL